MNRAHPVELVLLLFFTFGSVSSRAAMSAKEVMTKNEENRKLQNVTSTATISTGPTDQSSSAKVKEFTWWRKLMNDGTHYNTLTRFHSPAEVRGEGILFLERAGDQNEVLLYLPNFKKIRRVETGQQSSSFMGSEFSYADIATPHVDDYSYKMNKEQAGCPGLSGVRCVEIESRPATESVRERTGYLKSVAWVRQDNFMVVSAEYFDLDDQLFKKMESSDIKEVDPQGHKWMAHTIKMENLKTKRTTVLKFDQVKVNTAIPDTVFTQQNLSREK